MEILSHTYVKGKKSLLISTFDTFIGHFQSASMAVKGLIQLARFWPNTASVYHNVFSISAARGKYPTFTHISLFMRTVSGRLMLHCVSKMFSSATTGCGYHMFTPQLLLTVYKSLFVQG